MYTKKIIDGYFEKTVTYDERLKFCPYGSCGIVKTEDDSIVLVSYTSPILHYSPKYHNIQFYATSPSYSRTTIKHVLAFLKEFLPNVSYYAIKDAYNKDYSKVWDIDEL